MGKNVFTEKESNKLTGSSIIIPDGYTHIGEDCPKLKSLTLSQNIKKIEPLAFLVVTCKADSYAYKYCKQNRINVITSDDI